MNFSDMVTQSVLLRACSIVILALTIIMCLVILTVEILRGESVNPTVWAIAGVGVGQAAAILHVNYGVQLQTTETGEPNVSKP